MVLQTGLRLNLEMKQESESKEEEIDEVDDYNEEEHDHKTKVPAEKKPIVQKPVEAPKDTDRQISKKELKKKELTELEVVLAELGYPTSEASGQEGTCGSNGEVLKEKNTTKKTVEEIGQEDAWFMEKESKSASSMLFYLEFSMIKYP
ncbi:hypothetical protein AgCh_017253 [Apium graveolens]